MGIILVAIVRCIFVTSLGCSLWQAVKGQDLDAGKTSDETYREVLDRVFAADRWLGDNRAIVVIRSLPTFHSESQLVLKFTKSGCEASYKKLDKRLDKTLAAPPSLASVEEAAQRVTFKLHSKSFDQKTSERLLDEIWGSISQSANKVRETLDSLQLDGTRYEIRVYTNLASISMVLLDSEASDDSVTGDLPIVRWLNTMRLSIDPPP
jgi:hypothetical protein